MISLRCAVLSLSAPLLVLACVKESVSGDEADAADEGDTADESGTGESDTTSEGDACEHEPPTYDPSSAWSVEFDGVGGGSQDLERSCTIEDEGDGNKLTLNCADLMFELTHSHPWSAAIPDVAGAGVQLHFVFVASMFGPFERWIRLDFVGEQLSVFLIKAAELEPSVEWVNPWNLAVGQECLSAPDEFQQALTLERDGEVLEVWAGESGQIGDQLEVWVDLSFRNHPLDGPPTWRELVIVSRGR